MKVFRKFASFIFLVLIAVCGFAAEDSVTEESWILAAQKFSLDKNRDYSKAIESAASVLPKLVLEQISLDTRRTVYRDELVAKKIDSLLTERISYFMELSREIKARDALVLNNYTMFEYQSALKTQEKKIKAVQEKIDKNLDTQRDVLFPDKADKKTAKKMKKEFETHTKPIALYKNNSETLFAPTENAMQQGVESRAFAKEISSAKISGLITGSMVVYGNYISVSAELYSFPSAKKIASVVEVGTLGEVRQVAENIAFAFLPKIANGIPVEIEFKIFPEEAAKNARLTIDSIVYTPIPEKAFVGSGVHSISIEAEGYARESFMYNFTDEDRYFVEVNFRQEYDGSVKLALSNYVGGSMFFDGRYIGESSATDFVDVPLKVNGKSVFGYFEGTVKDKDGERTETMFMMIPSGLMTTDAELEIKMNVFDVGKNIDRHRKRMYIAYSSLLIALPFMFYSYGRFTTLSNAYSSNFGDVSTKELNLYRNLSFAGIGVVSACGAWMLTELVLYLIAVDKTLPPRAKKVKSRTLRKMEAMAETEAETEADAEIEEK